MLSVCSVLFVLIFDDDVEFCPSSEILFLYWNLEAMLFFSQM